MKERFKIIILFLISGTLLFSCNKKKEGDCIHDKAAILITVVDNNGNKVGNATINVFDSFDNYEKSRVQKNNSAYATGSARSISTSEVQLLVDPYVEHWLLVTYYDTIQLKFLSSELTTSKLDKLQSCSDYHITVTLAPLGANVAFWAATPLNIPIAVQFNNITDTLKNVSATQPINATNPGTPYELVFPVKAGTYAYQATSLDGCSWQGQVTVVDGQFTTVKLETCQRALLAFYYSPLSFMPSSKNNISIYMDNNPVPVGTLSASILNSTLTGPGSCSAPAISQVLYVYVEPGVSHTYKALSIPGSNGIPCVWSGTTGVLNTNCALNPPVFLGQGCY
jgi:hypothetical protein